jgi:Tfp pilus assembly protein PilN
MPSINMIATRRAEKHRFEQTTRNIAYTIAGEIGIFFVVASFMLVQMVQAQGQVSDLNEKIIKLKPQVDQIQSLEQQTAHLQPKLTVLNAARSSTLYWYSALQNLSESLSPSANLVSVVSSGNPAGPAAGAPPAPGTAPVVAAQLAVQGIALTQSDVGETMLRMNQYPQFDNVTLNFAQSSGAVAGSKTSTGCEQFQMTIALHSTAPPAPAKTASTTTTTGDTNAQKS